MKAQSCFLCLLAPGLGALLLAGSGTGGIAPPVAAGIGQPAVRVNAQSLDKIGTGNIIFSSQVIFNGDASLITGDVYAQANVTFPQYRKSPLCAGGATATNLLSPQVLAGTVISSGGGPNGIRYIPLLPPTNVLAQACARNVNPGVNVFDEVAALDGIRCATLVETTSATSVTFRGTNTNPEGLVIDNGEQPVWISPSTSGTAALTCTNTNFDRYNWRLILATGDVALGPNMIFSGFIYTRGNIFLSGHTLVRGGIFAASIQGAGTQFSSVVAGTQRGT